MKKVKLGYNGWSNYETWLVSVHLIIEYIGERALEEMEIADQISNSKDLKEVIEDSMVDEGFCEELFYDFVGNGIPRNGIIADFVNSAISEIDFREIADHVNDYLEEEGERLQDELRGSGRR